MAILQQGNGYNIN